MSHSINAKTNKQQKQPKIQTKQYLNNSSEPEVNYDFHMSAALEAEMLQDSFFMRQRIRRNAQRIRKLYY